MLKHHELSFAPAKMHKYGCDRHLHLLDGGRAARMLAGVFN